MARYLNLLLVIGPSVGIFFLMKHQWGKGLGILGYFVTFAFCLYWMPRFLGSLGFPPWPDRRNA